MPSHNHAASATLVGTNTAGNQETPGGNLLARDADVVVRYQGGNNAGHTIVIGDETHRLRKFEGLNERTCLNQTPVVLPGDRELLKSVFLNLVLNAAQAMNGQGRIRVRLAPRRYRRRSRPG